MQLMATQELNVISVRHLSRKSKGSQNWGKVRYGGIIIRQEKIFVSMVLPMYNIAYYNK